MCNDGLAFVPQGPVNCGVGGATYIQVVYGGLVLPDFGDSINIGELYIFEQLDFLQKYAT